MTPQVVGRSAGTDDQVDVFPRLQLLRCSMQFGERCLDNFHMGLGAIFRNYLLHDVRHAAGSVRGAQMRDQGCHSWQVMLVGHGWVHRCFF
ncbi:hypothetical protein FQZ97_1135710 [compost metagenome]